MSKRHINEFRRTALNSGRVAGIGIYEDRYDEESGPGGTNYQKQPAFDHHREPEHGEVTTHYLQG